MLDEEKDELQKRLEEDLKSISDGDQSMQAIDNLAAMVARFYKTLVELEITEEDAISLCQTYIDSVLTNTVGK